ncbi:putative bifunctional diguanylate cyclase/phosphodiesterase [Methyloversatilis thermotolerans]|uniref:putative bifunctional diguanylate cyclase/phosphodiesterase n=1 Tax=Methyloversatilis thermotolerans TaxID=1346290 RepID=UPI000367F4FE|nr:GGDEF domain-containing response regulator [Methyloversatilis thermotolerans]
MDRHVDKVGGFKTIKVLMVEDNEDDVFLLNAQLSARGLDTYSERVDSAQDLARALEERDWDLIISDHAMPGFDSASALDVVRRSGHDIPFIIYSGKISDQMAFSAMRNGVADYVQKGNIARLVPVIERELRGVEARRAVQTADARIHALAFFDTLSALPNQTLLRAQIDDWLDTARRSVEAQHATLMVVDIDHFLRINTSFGYDAGNAVLREVVRRLIERAGAGAMIARLSGDRFCVFAPSCRTREAAVQFAQGLMDCFLAPVNKDGLELYLTASVGIAMTPDDGDDAQSLIMNAEAAMAVVKRSGGNSMNFYSRELRASSAEKLVLETHLRHAVQRGEFFLHYQPILNGETGEVSGVEALLRWKHPQRGVVSPDRFIPLADESGLIVEIGAWVMREACSQGKRWHSLGLDHLSVSVNVSAVQFAQPRLLETVRSTLEDTGFPADKLVLEITESVLMKDAETTIGMLKALKHMGVRISMDDFGTGYSSLSYLKRFPIDIVKIDKSFVRDIGEDEDDAAIIRVIIALARSLRLTTVAEGVETPEQLGFLKREHCDRFQGYFFSRPVDADSITRCIRDGGLTTAGMVRH